MVEGILMKCLIQLVLAVTRSVTRSIKFQYIIVSLMFT